MICSHPSVRASRSPVRRMSNSRFVTANKMKRPIVEKTVRILIAIAFSIPMALAQGRSFTIQVESVISEDEARASVAKLRAQGLEAYWVKTTIPDIGIRYRVRIGRYQNQAQARAKADQLLGASAIKEFIVTTYDAPPSDSVAPDESKPATSPSNVPGRTRDKPGSREKKNTPEAKTEAGPGSRPRRTSSAEPAGDTPATAEAAAGVIINNGAWKVVNHGVEIVENLRAVYFLDSMTGWAAGDAGAIYRTTDGGGDWKPQSPGSGADINFIYFIDLNHGWMLGNSGLKTGDENGGENFLFITTDGGRNWTRKPLPNVTSLHFTDAKNGWAVGRNFTLLKTTDGGVEWISVGGVEKLIGSPAESSNYNFGFSDIHFTDAKRGWLIGNYYGRARNDIGGIFKTSDGGATWK